MIFRQLFDAATSTFTYLLGDADTGQAILIDSVFEQHVRDVALVRELGLTLTATLDTHVHADHVTGAWLMKEAVGSQIIVAEKSGAKFMDRAVGDSDVIYCGNIPLRVYSTPGHTSGCLSYVCDEHGLVFTGDALLIRGAGRTDFQEGSAELLFESVRDRLFDLDDQTLVYPAHDYAGRTVTTIAEEKEYNPRLGQKVRREDFVGYMANLGLPHPKKLEIAVPANLRCGRPEGDHRSQSMPAAWGPVVRTYAGVLQVEPDWVQEHRDNLIVVDVRETAELASSALGQIPGAMVVPLSELRDRATSLPRAKPIVTVCPAGARSAMAATILEQAGVEQVANLRGGLLEWQGLGYPLERSA